MTRPDLVALMKAQPDHVAQGFARIRFLSEARLAVNLLGDQGNAGATILDALANTACNADFAAFAAARKAQWQDRPRTIAKPTEGP